VQSHVSLTLEVSGQLNALVALPPGKEPPYSLDSSLSGPHRQFGRHGEGDFFYSTWTRTGITEGKQ
jgi:hypothetical protein